MNHVYSGGVGETRSGTKRRAPTQRRSRERVGQILDAAADLVVERGVAAVGTRMIAERARIPIASLYQYFAGKDEIILELVKRDTAEMDTQVATGLAELETLSVRTIVETTMRAFVAVYHRRPAFVVIWWRGRTNQAVVDYCREHNRRIAADLFEFGRAHGLLDADPVVAELAVEVGDRIFQLAFEHDPTGDEHLLREGVELVVGYLERYATAGGLTGVPATAVGPAAGRGRPGGRDRPGPRTGSAP